MIIQVLHFLASSEQACTITLKHKRHSSRFASMLTTEGMWRRLFIMGRRVIEPSEVYGGQDYQL
ncbi:MAG: hypothetical protein V7746_09690 [Halioglobus sp.]